MSYSVTPSDITGNPIAWDDIKYWLKLDDNFERENLLQLAGDMLAWAEGVCGSTIVRRPRTVQHFEAVERYEVPAGPVVSITGVTDADGQAVAHNVERAGVATYVRVAAGVPLPLTIVYVAGYEPVPRPIKRAVLMAVQATHRDRTGEADLAGIERILKLHSYAVGVA